MSNDLQSLYRRAEQAFAQGRFDDACADLALLEPQVPGHAAIPHLRAVAERRRGGHAQSRLAFERALKLARQDAQIANNYGNLLSDMGELQAALDQYEYALGLRPDFGQAALNAAITLRQLGRHREAEARFEALEAQLAGSASYWAARGAFELDRADLAAAARCFDAALAVDPVHPRALALRARVARFEGDGAAVALYARAAAADPDNRGLLIEEAETRAAEGDAAGLERLEAAVRMDPLWLAGQDALARTRWELGDRDHYLDQVERARSEAPRSAELWMLYLRLLADSGDFVRAADAAREAESACGEQAGFALSEAVYAGLAGDDDRAERLFARLPADAPDRAAHEARHRVRRGELDRAEALLAAVRSAAPADVAAWAMTEVVWRASGDVRSDWLSGAPELVGLADVGLSDSEIVAVAELLRGLHRLRARPLGQSLRGGTQTRHRLFDRREPELVRLRDALRGAVEQHRAALPPQDERHPLLRHRDRPLEFTGSWSVRLESSGHHVSHIHPEGVMSSACYISVPALDPASREGWLELGVPPADLRLDLPPLRVAEPRPGRLALFPSYLFHGTRPFAAGERLTVAFDVAPA